MQDSSSAATSMGAHDPVQYGHIINVFDAFDDARVSSSPEAIPGSALASSSTAPESNPCATNMPTPPPRRPADVGAPAASAARASTPTSASLRALLNEEEVDKEREPPPPAPPPPVADRDPEGDTVERVARAVCGPLSRLYYAEAWRWDEEGGVFRCLRTVLIGSSATSTSSPSRAIQAFRRQAETSLFGAEADVIGRASRSRAMEWLVDCSASPRSTFARSGGDCPVRACVALPTYRAAAPDRPYVVFLFFSARALEYDPVVAEFVRLSTAAAVFPRGALVPPAPPAPPPVRFEDLAPLAVPRDVKLRNEEAAASAEATIERAGGGPFLRKLAALRRPIVARAHLAAFPAARTLFSRGEPGTSAYVILSGSVRCFDTASPAADEGWVLRAGDALGESALLVPRSKRLVTAVAASDVAAIEIDFSDLVPNLPSIRDAHRAGASPREAGASSSNSRSTPVPLPNCSVLRAALGIPSPVPPSAPSRGPLVSNISAPAPAPAPAPAQPEHAPKAACVRGGSLALPQPTLPPLQVGSRPPSAAAPAAHVQPPLPPPDPPLVPTPRPLSLPLQLGPLPLPHQSSSPKTAAAGAHGRGLAFVGLPMNSSDPISLSLSRTSSSSSSAPPPPSPSPGSSPPSAAAASASGVLSSVQQRWMGVKRKRDQVSLEEVSTLFHLPLHKAAEALGCSTSTLKLICRDLGLPAWPHRRIKLEQAYAIATQRVPVAAAAAGAAPEPQPAPPAPPPLSEWAPLQLAGFPEGDLDALQLRGFGELDYADGSGGAGAFDSGDADGGSG